MKKHAILVLVILMTSVTALAQTVETTFIIKDTKNGEEVVDVEYNYRESKFNIDSFTEADTNVDGCIDQTEAHDKGILDFDRFARTNKNCLNESEYLEAMTFGH